MDSLPAFIAVAVAVTLTPGAAFALLLQAAAVHGLRVALATVAGNSVGVLVWGVLSALGLSALVAANQLAYDALRVAGAVFLLWLGVQALRSARSSAAEAAGPGPRERGIAPSRPALRAARKGLINSLANPKLAVFFVSLFPQFLSPGADVLPAALAMAAVIVVCDVVWYGAVAVIVDRFRTRLRPRLLRRLERASGAVLVAFGVRLAAEAR
jgi:threonine/homoserine/homoserine lactone efflux protein